MPDCLFCAIVAGDVPADIVRTDELTVAFRDINPQSPVHVLVVPRRHIVSAAAVDRRRRRRAGGIALRGPCGGRCRRDLRRGPRYRLVFNVGPDALNSVDHLHLHLLGGRTFDWPPG